MATYSVHIPGRATNGQRPSGPVSLNRAHALAHALRVWWPGQAATPIRPSPLGYNAITSVGTGTFATPSRLGGYDVAFTGGTAYCQNITPVNIAALDTAYSFGAWVLFDTTATQPCFMSFGTDSGYQNHFLIIRGGGLLYEANDAGGAGTVLATTGITPVTGVYHHVVAVTRSASSHTIYLNGVPYAGTGTGQSAVPTKLSIGRYLSAGGGFDPLTGAIPDAFYCRGALTQAQVWQLYDPATRWDLYQVPSRRVFFDVGGGPPVGVNRRRRVLIGAAA